MTLVHMIHWYSNTPAITQSQIVIHQSVIAQLAAGSLSRKERKDHNGAFKATAHDCSTRHSCPHLEKEDEYGIDA